MLKGVTFKMKKTFLIVWLVIMIVLAISVVSFAEDITLRFTWAGAQDRTDRTLKVIKLFEEKYPNVKIQPEAVSWDGFYEKLSIQAAGKNLPDIFQADVNGLTPYVERDLLLNLNPYVEDNRLDLTSCSEVGISTGMYNGKLYGPPAGINTQTAFVYNPELFKKAGVEEPTLDWTWEDYTEKARKIHTALGIYADDTYDICIDAEGLWAYLIQHGKTLYDKSGKKLGYEDDSLFVDYYTRFLDLIKEGVNAPAEVGAEVYQNAENYFITKQKTAMLTWPSNSIVLLTEAAGRPLSMTIIPNAKDQVQYGTTISSCLTMSVAKNSKYPEWAVKFIDFFLNDLEANKIMLAERGVPDSSKIREGIRPYLNDSQKVLFNYTDLVMKYSSPVINTYPINHNKIQDLLRTTYEKMAFGKITVEEAAKEFREKANKILSED
jgi:multiple sugar transport system substrate-binding protein